MTQERRLDIGEQRPIKRAFLVLVGLGAFFYASYGLANWLAGLRGQVPSIVFSWEHFIPFLDWTIFPYWTTNIFYAASLLLSRTREELDRHARRLLTAQLIAVFFFIATPLKFTWPKPETSGVSGFMFEALGAFDKPFNQAPSLHVALTIIIAAQFARLLPRPAFLIFLAWSVLVVASVMTTYQHHFIDIPTGALLGLFCLWLWPDDRRNAWTNWRLTDDPQRRRLAGRYGAASILSAAIALGLGGGWLWLLWLSLALAGVACAYLAGGPTLFQKNVNGRMAWPARLLLAPYLVGAWLNSRWWTRSDPKAVEIADGVHVGRFPAASDLKPFGRIVDLTCEFVRPAGDEAWTSIPMLDLVAPDRESLRRAADAIEAARSDGRSTLACCALGYGRSVAAVIVWLVLTGRAATIADAIAMVRAKRPRMQVSKEQMKSVADAIRQ